MKFFSISKNFLFWALLASYLAQPFSVLAAAPAVTGLAATFSTNSATLTWTTPADTSLTELEIRYAVGSLNDGNFNLATQISNAPLPEAGKLQSVLVAGLAAGTGYVFGVRTRNFIGEESPIVYVSGNTTSSGGGGGPVDVCVSPTVATSFQVPTVTSNSASLSWILPNLTNLSDLEIRYATTPINDGSFNLATQVSNSPLPEANTTQNFTVGGLNSNTVYYFAIKLWNVCGEESLITTVSAATASSGGGGACQLPIVPTSLAVGGATAGSLNFSWITPNQTNLSELEARYSNRPLNDGNFNLATRLNTPNPEAGIVQSVIATGLTSNTTYYFGLRTQTACGDYSGIVYVVGSTNNTPSGGGGGGGGGSAVYSDTRLVINNGAATTNNRAVVLSVLADDPLEMWLSESKNFETGAWEPFATSTVWILSSGLGSKTVYAKFRDDQFTGFSQAKDDIELVSGPSQPFLPSTSTIPTAPSNNPIYINNTILSTGRVWLEIIPKDIKISGDSEIRAVVIAHADGLYADYFRLEMKYPTKNLRLKSVEFAPGMVPDFSPNANFENIERGLLVKSARSEVPFTGRKMFGVLVFEPLIAGQGSLEILAGANLGEDNWYSDFSVVSNPGSNSNLIANLVSVNKENNAAAMLGVWMFFVLLYAGYLAFQKYKKGL